MAWYKGFVAAQLAARGQRLTFLDIGASVALRAEFRKLRGVSCVIAVEPDDRARPSSDGGGVVWVNKAVVGEALAKRGTIYLTKNPTCSSLLRPNFRVVEKYLLARRFEVVGTREVETRTLKVLLEEMNVERVDWVKVDAQGLDLEIIRGLGADSLQKVAVIDIEPGFDEFYVGEGTFEKVHRELTERGFWLAELGTTSAVRMSERGAKLAGMEKKGIWRLIGERALRRSPVAANARYVRDVDRIKISEPEESSYLRLWAACVIAGQLPYAIEVLACWGERIQGAPIEELVRWTRRRLWLQGMRGIGGVIRAGVRRGMMRRVLEGAV